MVDGVVEEQPQFMVTEQKIELHPDASLAPPEPVTMLLHQPASTIPELYPLRAETRVANDPSGIRLLKQHFLRLEQHLPLEANASGMVIYTQDWRVARKLTEDAALLEQEYIVEVSGDLSDEGLKRLNHRLTYNGRDLSPCKVSWQNETRLRFAIKGIRPGQIAHMCHTAGLQILTQKRIRIGRVSMGKLPQGQWGYLMAQEKF